MTTPSSGSSALEITLEQPNVALIWLGRLLLVIGLVSLVLALLAINVLLLGLTLLCGLGVWLCNRPLTVLTLDSGGDVLELTRYSPALGLGRGRALTLGVRKLSFLRGVDIVTAQNKRGGSGLRTQLRFDSEETLELRGLNAPASEHVQVAEAIRDFLKPRVIPIRKP